MWGRLGAVINSEDRRERRREEVEGSEGPRVRGFKGQREKREERQINTERTEGGRRYTEKKEEAIFYLGEEDEAERVDDFGSCISSISLFSAFSSLCAL